MQGTHEGKPQAFTPASLRIKRTVTKPKLKPPRPAGAPLQVKPEELQAMAPQTTAPEPRAPRMLPLGECRSVDAYARLNLIAESQYGVVYRARNKATGTIVALKKFKHRKEPDGFPITFLREINILFTIRHPHIITAEEVVTAGSVAEEASWFLVMEYVDHDLKDLIMAMKTPFLEAQVKHFMRQLMSAIAALHEAWVLHRDLKTTNLLVDYRGVLKVCDFGMARHCGSPFRPYTEEVISRWYRPPEILMGKPTYTTAVDIWSTGCIFGELLQRAVAIPGDSEVDQLDKTFALIGTPTADSWPEYEELAKKKGVNFPARTSMLRTRFPKVGYEPANVHGDQCKTTSLSDEGLDLLHQMLLCDPSDRIAAADILDHAYFSESPAPEPLTPEHLAQLKRDRGEAIAKAKQVADAKAKAAAAARTVQSMGMGIGMGMMPASMSVLGRLPPPGNHTGFSNTAAIQQLQMQQMIGGQPKMK